MKLLNSLSYLTILFLVGVNLTWAADSGYSSFEKLPLDEDSSFLRTKNLLDLKNPNILDEVDTPLNLQRKIAIKNSLNRILDGVMQVHPGTENPKIGSNRSEGRVFCENNICKQLSINNHSSINPQGKKNINYSLEGFQSVGVLVIYKPDNIEACNFVIISPEVILTARHCVDKENRDLPKAWLLMKQDNVLNTDLPLKLNGCKNPIGEGNGNCTYHRLRLSDTQFDKLWVDEEDLALLKLDAVSLPAEFNSDLIPQLDFSNTAYSIVTLVGNGKSNIENYNSRRPLVGWFKGNFIYNSKLSFLDASETDTKPAPGDSGSPVFRGEYFGRKCELNTNNICSPYLLSAIVTSGYSQNKIKNANDAIKAKTAIVRLSYYKNFICMSSNKIKGCEL